MMKHTQRHMERSKDHMFAAGKELLMAAQETLDFCRSYAEYQAWKAYRSDLWRFVSKKVAKADRLGKELMQNSSVSRAVESFSEPIFQAIEREWKGNGKSHARTTETRQHRRTPSRTGRQSRKTRKARRVGHSRQAQSPQG